MKSWASSECGVVGGGYCAKGSSYVAGPGKLYYGYCVGYDKNLAKRNHRIIEHADNDMNPIGEDGANADLSGKME